MSIRHAEPLQPGAMLVIQLGEPIVGVPELMARVVLDRIANLRTGIAAYAGAKPIQVKRLDPDGCFTWRPADVQPFTDPQSDAQ